MSENNMTRQQRKKASRDRESPWSNIMTPSQAAAERRKQLQEAEERNARYRAAEKAKLEAAGYTVEERNGDLFIEDVPAYQHIRNKRAAEQATKEPETIGKPAPQRQRRDLRAAVIAGVAGIAAMPIAPMAPTPKADKMPKPRTPRSRG